MKFWNKDKHVREQHWTQVPGPGRMLVCTGNKIVSSSVLEKIRSDQRLEKLRLQRMPGKDKFYYDPTSFLWWFENEADALCFKLQWNNRA